MWLWQRVPFREDKWVSRPLQTYWTWEKGEFGKGKNTDPSEFEKGKHYKQILSWGNDLVNHGLSLMSQSSSWWCCARGLTQPPQWGPSVWAPLAAVYWTAPSGICPALHPSLPFLTGSLGTPLRRTHSGQWYKPPRTEGKGPGSCPPDGWGKAGAQGWGSREETGAGDPRQSQGPRWNLTLTEPQFPDLQNEKIDLFIFFPWDKATHSSILAWRNPWTVHGVAKSQTRPNDFFTFSRS